MAVSVVEGATQAKACAPFGLIEQRELEYMTLCGFSALDCWAFVVLRVRSDRTKVVHDRIDTLARWSCLGARTMQRSLASLARRSVILRKPHPVKDGARGQAFSWTTTILPYEAWPTEPLVRTIATMVAYLEVLYPSKEHAARALSSVTAKRKNTPEATEEHARIGGRTRLATRDNPESYPEVFPESSSDDDEAASLPGYEDEERLEEALAIVRGLRGGAFRAGPTRAWLVAYRRRRPRVDLVADLRRLEEARERPRTDAAWQHWLDGASDVPAALTDRECVVTGCSGVGRGSLGRCMEHTFCTAANCNNIGRNSPAAKSPEVFCGDHTDGSRAVPPTTT